MASLMRSVLFCPADQPEFVAKAERANADAIVIDLEDAIAPRMKDKARSLLAASVGQHRRSGGRAQLFVRVNGPLSPFFHDDVQSLPVSVDGVVIPKVESSNVVEEVCSTLRARSADPKIVVGIETVDGIDQIDDVLSSGAFAVYWGAEDFVADLGGRRTRGGIEVLYPRSLVAFRARKHGSIAIDQAVVTFRDIDRFRQEAEDARALGYRGKICVHPNQVSAANELFSPSDLDVQHARQLVDAYESALAAGVGVSDFGGVMVDEALVRSARAILATASEIAQTRA